MSPPTEQLIRDYLNRLSVACRGRLSAEDRRALVNRTHDFIDRNASRSGPATSMQVAALLSRLGDPSVLVDQEVARLAATRGDSTGAQAPKPGRRGARLRRGNAQASWHWPVVAGSPDLQSELLGGSPQPPALNGTASNGEVKPAMAGPPVLVPMQGGPVDEEPAVPGPDGPAPDAPAGQGEPPARDPDGPADASQVPAHPAWPAAAVLGPGGQQAPEGATPDTATPDTATSEPAVPEAATTAPATPGPATPMAASHSVPAAVLGRPGGAAGGTLAGSVRASASSLAARVAAGARRHPGEAVAITLLGLGGVLYPPVWLLGALGALIARGWNYRDRWIGLAGPVLLLVLGTAAGVMLGPSHAKMSGYVHEGWLYADILSRIGAVAGTWYLAWRLEHPWRVPDVPPWNKPHKVD